MTVVLTLTAPRALEDRVVQVLLEHEVAGEAGFSVREVYAYGRGRVFKTVAERIGGRIRQIEVEFLISADRAQLIVDQLGSSLGGLDVSWRIHTLTAAGTFP
ncbi:MAG: hypothetical protein ABS35_18910 [Kaistia sp. SCN 65-12]|nr:MAG: hypothetical protein ABS35_18910 [Kaistia sp. SCN 65-12]